MTECLNSGASFKPRGLDCLELRPFCFSLRNPGHSLCRLIDRRLNYRFFVIEFLGYITGRGDTAWTKLMVDSNRNIERFVNPETLEFDGAYGPKLKQSLRDVITLLGRDCDSRQGVASIWSPGIPTSRLDVPCTLSLSFYKGNANNEHPKLSMTAHMRSNDLNWGSPYDIAAFTTIQLVVAAMLGWQIGKYTHLADSLHVYKENLPKVGHDKYALLELPYFRVEDLEVLDGDTPSLSFDRHVAMFDKVLEKIYEDRAMGKKWSDIEFPETQSEFIKKLEKIFHFQHIPNVKTV